MLITILSFVGSRISFAFLGTGQIVLDDLQCTGSESRLIDCPHSGLGNHNCDHYQDAGVTCRPGIIKLSYES